MEWKNEGGWLYASGKLGRYEIAEIQNHTPETHSEFIVSVCKNDGHLKLIGEFTSEENAKWAAENYEGYRAS